MKILELFFVATCCVAAINATSLDSRSIRKDADDKYKVSVPDKQDIKWNQRDSEGDKKGVKDDITKKENEKREKDKEEKEKKYKDEKERKEREEKERKEREEREKKEKEEREKREKEVKEKKGKYDWFNDKQDSKEKNSKEKNSHECNEKYKGGRKDDSSEEDCSDSKGDKIKKIWKDKTHHNGGKKPCGRPTEPACNTFCILIEDPLCASPDGFEGEPKTFDNECLLDVYNCQNPKAKYKKTSDGACKPVCPQVCPFYVDPICALPDGWCGEPREFGNPCYLAVYNCENPTKNYKHFHEGSCYVEPTDCGLIDCPQDVSPFCAIPTGSCGQPKTFNNKCLLEVYNCFNPDEQYEYFHDGECLTTPAPCIETSCPNDDKPICGLPDGFCGEPKTFANECYRNVYNTFNSNEQYKYFHDGECITTPAPCIETSCPNDNSPICGLPNGFCGEPKTFANECYRNVYNTFNPNAQYEYFHDGECIEQPKQCPTSCPFNYDPVCARGQSGNTITHANACTLEAHNCENEDDQHEYIHDGECDDCVDIQCNKIGQLICATNSDGVLQTFGNPCMLQQHNCDSCDQFEYLYDGSCNEEPVCPTVCPLNYDPQCARGQSGDLRTFGNACALAAYNCENEGDQYSFSYAGECDECAEILCNKIGKPICATNSNGVLQTFGNPCMLQLHNCDNCDDKYEYLYDGNCVEEPKCPTFCPLNYVPQCAKGQSGDVRTFGNECALAAHNCENEGDQYTFLYAGECNECADIQCNKIGKPVCATDSKGNSQTFGNLCMLQQNNCESCNEKFEYAYDGNCVEESQCPTFCPFNYVPQCARGQSGDVRTFGNECALAAHNCENEGDQYTFLYAGECNECADIQCNKIGKPVCATDSKGNLQTFGNLCMMQQNNCESCNEKFEYAYDGTCNEPVICTKEYMPVCAISPTLGPRTFDNKCLRDAHISQNPADGYVAAYDGECKKVCKLACQRDYRPLCGVNSKGEEKLFTNQCEYEKYNCLNPNDEHIVAYDGECNNCTTGCFEIYDPVCGVDADGNEVTYSNECEFDSHNCRYPRNQYTLAYEGECHNCNVVCLAIYDPVCATDQNGNEITYGSQCELDSYNCRYPFNVLSFKHKGECNNCQIGCEKIYAPVCATDSNGNEIQFGNQCQLDSHNCVNKNDQCFLSYEGECHECNFGCTDHYDPVCSVDPAGNERTFPNECDYENYVCRYPYNSLSIAYQGECHKCQTMCLAIHKPVCAKDSSGTLTTYGNQCELDSYNCRYPYNIFTVQYQGECRKPCVDNCPTDCKPVCASANINNKNSETRTFANQCFLESYNCHNPTKAFTKVSDGECPVDCKKLKCPKEQSWVCANCQDSKVKPSSFYNDCERQLHNCNNPNNKFYYSRDGQCDGKY